MARGGKRPGSGPAKGAKYAPTIAKEQAREVARQLITAQLKPMIDAQIANAQGLKYLVTRDKSTGKFVRVTEVMARWSKAKEDEIDGRVAAIISDPRSSPEAIAMIRTLAEDRRVLKAAAGKGEHEEDIEVWEKDPSVQAFTDLMNRALDKPKEQPQELDVNINQEALFARLDRGRERNSKREKESGE